MQLNKRLEASKEVTADLRAEIKQQFAKIRQLVANNFGRTARIEEGDESITFIYKAVGNAEILDLSPQDLIDLGQGLKRMDWTMTITPLDAKSLEVQVWKNFEQESLD